MSIEHRKARAKVLEHLRDAEFAIEMGRPRDVVNKAIMRMCIAAAASDVPTDAARVCARALWLAYDNPAPKPGALSPAGIAGNASLILSEALWHPWLSRTGRGHRLREVEEMLDKYEYVQGQVS